LYLLLHASTEKQNRNDVEIQRLTRFYVEYIWRDIVNQLASVCVARFADVGLEFGIPDLDGEAKDMNAEVEEHSRKIRAMPIADISILKLGYIL
jgi:wobble nucleotide-excising tRNase